MLDEIIQHLGVRRGGRYIDGTVGLGGHFALIAEIAGQEGFVVGCDVDASALLLAEANLREKAQTTTLAPWRLYHSSYERIESLARELPEGKADGILFDFGCSSLQFDDPSRGFSFKFDSPLDMRFDTSAGISASDVVNDFDEGDLADIIFRFGEERRSRSIARGIVAARRLSPVLTTGRLKEIVESVVGRRSGKTAGATRTFQALRIYVNGELDAVAAVLPRAFGCLSEGGAMATLTFHSLEDRIVKDFNREIARLDKGVLLTRKPVTPAREELRRNPRSRSAKLRVVRKGVL